MPWPKGKPNLKRGAPHRDKQREVAMMKRYLAGETLAQIGASYDLSRERVRQLIKRYGIARHDGGRRVRAQIKAEDRARKRDAASLKKHGCSYAEYRAILKAGGTQPFRFQKRTAIYRGIEWKFTLAEWWAVWQASGKWSLRRRGSGGYCMSRHCDTGAYEPGNVTIKLNEENGREFQDRRRAAMNRKRPLPRGVYLSYPGYCKPYQVKHGKLSLGLYATAVEAIAAKNAHVAALKRAA